MTVAHFPLERLAEAMRADGVEVEILPGAQGRSARMFTSGYHRGCQAVVEHHTASSGWNPENDIRYINGGKGDGYIISNAYTWRTRKKITLIASGPTYTEGRGGPRGIIPENGGNTVSFSNEIAHPGDNSPYPDFQQEAILSFAFHAGRIAAEVWGWPDDPYGPNRAFSHFEWTTRKIDPHGTSRWSPNGGKWNMDEFRADLRSYQTITPPPEEDDMGMNVTKLRFEGYAEQLVCFRASADTLRTMGIFDDDVVVLANPTPEQRAAIEAGLGNPLSPL